MTNSSTQNSHSKKSNIFEEDYQSIFNILDDFIEQNKQKKYSRKKQGFINEDSLISLISFTIPFLPLIYAFILLTLEIQFNTLFFKIISIVFSLISVIMLLSIILKEVNKAKNMPNLLIKKSCEQGLKDLAFSEKLAKFDKSTLNYAERRLKLLVETRNISNQKINSVIPFIALVMAIVVIYTYLSDDFNFTPANIMLTSGITSIIFKGIVELTDDPTIYKKCLAVVEYARVLAEEFQDDELTYLPKKNISNNNLMEALSKHKLNQPSDFDHNS